MGTTAAPDPARSRDRLVELLSLAMVAVVAAACWIWFRLHTGIRLEDALITWRYARHLAEGSGFVFNPGERVLGTTTPLLTLGLGLAGAILGVERIPPACGALMMLAETGAGVMTFLALRSFGIARGAALGVAAALLVNPQMLWMTTGGMETPLVLMLMAASLWALAARRPLRAALAAALLVLARIDGVFWAAGVLICILLEHRVALLRSLGAFAGALAPWVVFASWYFGSPIPHSVIAKRAIGPESDFARLPHLVAHAAWNAGFFSWSFPFAPAVGWAAFAAGAFVLLRRPFPAAARLLVVFPCVFSAALYLGRSPLWFDWYLAPVGYASLIVGLIGCAALLGPPAAMRPWARRAALAGVVAYFGLLALQGRQEAARQRDYQTNEDGMRRVVGEWLRDNTPPAAVVAMEAVGYQAWYADRRVIDLAGLVSPAVVSIRAASRSNAEAFYRVLSELRPDYLVLRSFEVDRNAHYHGGPLFDSRAQVAYFGRHYEEVRRFEAPLPAVWGDTSYLTVYRRMRGP